MGNHIMGLLLITITCVFQRLISGTLRQSNTLEYKMALYGSYQIKLENPFYDNCTLPFTSFDILLTYCGLKGTSGKGFIYDPTRSLYLSLARSFI